MAPKIFGAKQLILDFFKGEKVRELKERIIVSTAPREFEEIYGRNAPYTIVFTSKAHKEIPDSELIAEGSYFITSMRDYMKKHAKTRSIDVVFSKKQIKEIGGEPSEDSRILEFVFLSNCQYLNEKKQYVSRVYVKDKKVVDVNMYDLTTHDSSLKDKIDASEEYKLAYEDVCKAIKSRVIDVKKNLRRKLKNELFRVNEHYQKQIKERDDEVARCQEKIRNLESQLKLAYFERDAKIVERKIREQKAQLEILEKEGYQARLRKEEAFHVEDETDKHALIMDHSLLNVGVINYSLFNVKGKLFDPLLKKFI